MTQGINALLDELRRILKCKNDAALARKLEVLPPVISKLGGGTLALGPVMILRMHDVSGMLIADIKRMAGDSLSKAEIAQKTAHAVIATAARRADKPFQVPA